MTTSRRWRARRTAMALRVRDRTRDFRHRFERMMPTPHSHCTRTRSGCSHSPAARRMLSGTDRRRGTAASGGQTRVAPPPRHPLAYIADSAALRRLHRAMAGRHARRVSVSLAG